MKPRRRVIIARLTRTCALSVKRYHVRFTVRKMLPYVESLNELQRVIALGHFCLIQEILFGTNTGGQATCGPPKSPGPKSHGALLFPLPKLGVSGFKTIRYDPSQHCR